jgi:CBS domain-containing protein
MAGRGTTFLAQTSVADAMHPGVYSCPAGTVLSEVAEIMAERGVHAVVVTGDRSEDSSPPGVISDLPAITARPKDTLELAAALMTRQATTHLVVVEWPSKRPVGVLSTMDIVTVLASRRGRAAASAGSRPDAGLIRTLH